MRFLKKGKILIILFLIFFVINFISSCRFPLEKASKISSIVPFNYRGLRFETRNIERDNLDNRYPVVVCFGDSVTFGWSLRYKDSYPAILEELLSTDYQSVKVINSGIGGDTVVDGYMRLNENVFYYEPDLVIINFGLNDGMIIEFTGNNFEENKSLIYNWNGNYSVPQVGLVDFYNYYDSMIKKIKASEIDIVIMGINPVLDIYPLSKDENFRKKQIEIYKLYNEKILEIGKRNNIISINLWDIFYQDGEVGKYIQRDGIHPNEKGAILIANSVYEHIIQNNVLK